MITIALLKESTPPHPPSSRDQNGTEGMVRQERGQTGSRPIGTPFRGDGSPSLQMVWHTLQILGYA